MSPFIKEAVRANGPNEVLDHIALPAGDVGAYFAILSWLDDTIVTGKIKTIEPIYTKPLSSYYNILEIAERLKIEPIARNLGVRLDKMITYVPGQPWNVQVEDVRYVHDKFAAGHSLRARLVENIAEAWSGDGFSRKKRREIVDFWGELKGRIAEVGEREQ